MTGMRLAWLEFTLLQRDRAVRSAVAVLLLAGFVALAHGEAFIGRQKAALGNRDQLQAEEHARVLAPLPASADAGEQLYYLFFHTVREPSAWAPFAIGQRDVQAYNLKVRLHALQGQLYDADLGNPLLSFLGHFDLAFVFVVLAPLLTIGITFNVFSGEEEGGTWPLLRSQHTAPWRILARRYGLRAAVIWCALMLLLGVATLRLGVALDRSWALVALGSLLYVLVWISAAIAVSALRRSSEFTVLALFVVWVVWTVLGPAVVNASASVRFQLPEALELTVLQRQGFHGAWDEPLPDVMASFYERYPEWRGAPVPTGTYSNAWYYAMHQRGDDVARDAARRYRDGVLARERWIARASWLFPPAAFERLLTRVARTDLQAHIAYLDSVATYHEQLKRHFFPAIFSGATVGAVDWSSTPRHHHRD